VLERGANFYPLDADPQTDRMAWVKWAGQAEHAAEPFADLIKWA
jgi:hypothetical protein